MSNKEDIPIADPDGDTDPATQAWRKENWVDEDKARVLAESEVPERNFISHFNKSADESLELARTHEGYARESFGDTASAHNKIAEGHKWLAAGNQQSAMVMAKSAQKQVEEASKKYDEEQARQAAERVVSKNQLEKDGTRYDIEPEEPLEQEEAE